MLVTKILDLYYKERLSTGEIAKRLNINEALVVSIIFNE